MQKNQRLYADTTVQYKSTFNPTCAAVTNVTITNKTQHRLLPQFRHQQISKRQFKKQKVDIFRALHPVLGYT